MAEITIFHTSDFHSRLDENSSDKLAVLKKSVPGSLLLDSGDAIKSGNITFNPWGEAMLSLMNRAGYDAMCVGNREYHFMAGPMKAKTFRAGFPLLSANMIAKGNNPAIEPYVDFNRDGLKVRIMGLSVPCVTKQMFVHHLADQYFEEPVNCGVQKANELRDGCDLLIALTHVGLKKDTELAEKAGVLDLILGGHTHTITEEPLKVGNTVILHHGFHAKNVGKVTIKFEDGIVDVHNQLLELRP
jgi:2',3'-cyclic-nucleotide 2'-phosphodiesterase (5'-nucleotidase family)